MSVRVITATLLGVEAVPVEVEVECRESGSHQYTIIGLGDSAVKEARERVLAALTNSGFWVPNQVLINLAPAEVRKEGSAFDLAMAVGILIASNQLKTTLVRGRAFFGELGLDGRVKPVRGVVAFALAQLEKTATQLIMPSAQTRELEAIPKVNFRTIGRLREISQILSSEDLYRQDVPVQETTRPCPLQLSEVHGQDQAKRAMVIAAAGSHNLLMVGPPGCGKSMLAQRLPGLLPPLNDRERIEVLRVQSIAGVPLDRTLAGERPFRSPHHSVSEAGLIGGGSIPQPGEATLAHHGVLFLDELPEYRRAAIESLRTPLEGGVITISRAKGRLRFPARFQLVAAMNPCPCGRFGNHDSSCRCSAVERTRYLKRISQPILDRIDLHVELNPVPVSVITAPTSHDGEAISQLINKICGARERQEERQQASNAHLADRELRLHCELCSSGRALLERASKKLTLSGRGVTRVIRVARTIADLQGCEIVEPHHLAEAISFRYLERFGLHGESQSRSA